MTTYTSPTIPQLLDNYTSFVTDPLATAINFQNATRILACVFKTILIYPTQDNLITVWNFFVDNQNGVVVENVALYGITALNQNDRSVFNLIYPMLRLATNGIQPTTSGNAISLLIRSPIIIEFLREAALTVVPGMSYGPGNIPSIGSSTTTLSSVDTTKGFEIVGGVLTITDSVMQEYILKLLKTFMDTAPTTPVGLPANTPWNNGGNLAFT